MRHRVSALRLLMLLAMLPVMNVLAAPAPAPSAILDIGPSPKGETAEQHRDREIARLTRPGNLIAYDLWHDPEVRKLPSVVALKPPREIAWFQDNLRVAPDGKGNCLRLTFRAGQRDEQVAILNSILRVYIKNREERLKFRENGLRILEAGEPRLAELIKEERSVGKLLHYLQEAENAKVTKADARDEISRLKQVTPIKWAR